MQKSATTPIPSIQSEGENWRAIRNGPLSIYGGWALLGIVVLLALFFAIRGRIKIEAGASGNRIVRFRGPERFAHWLMASTFIILALSGLNMLYGRYVLLPILGPDAFASTGPRKGQWPRQSERY